MKIFIVIIGVMFLHACKKTGENACNGNTRRDVKIMIDDLSGEVDTVPVVTTIKVLGELAVPDVKTETGRQAVEKQVYTVTGKINKIKRYRDGDYHIRLEDCLGNNLITEVPNPDCKHAVGTKYADTYRKLVTFIKVNNLKEGQTITVTGVSFIDIKHPYSRKQAANNLELHPILKLSF